MCVQAIEEPNKTLRDAYGPNAQIDLEEVSSTQTLAAISLGEMGNISAVDVLLPVLKSADGPARVAAAMGILRLLPAYRKAEAARPPAPVAVPAAVPAAPKVPAPVGKPAPKVTPSSPTSAPVAKPAISRPKLITSGARD